MSGVIQARRAEPPRLALERVIGTTTLSNASFAVNHITGDIATAAGCIVVLYSPSKNKQTRFFRTKQAISCLAFSKDGQFLAAGQKGRSPTITVWSMSTGIQRAEFGEYTYGVACVAFSPDSRFVVGVGFKNDRALHVWDWSRESGPAKTATGKLSQKVTSLSFFEDGEQFVTAGEKHLKFWSLEAMLRAVDTAPGLNSNNNIIPGGSNNINSVLLSSKPAVMSEGGTDFESFVDVVAGSGASAAFVYALSSAGMLCAFDASERLMEQWVSLRVGAAFSLDIAADTIFVGCSNGIVRAFSLPSLVFKGLLPLPPAVGRANVSVFDAIPSPKPTDVYPAAIAVRPMCGGNNVAVLYGDRSFFLWDVTNYERIMKVRSWMCHSGPVWDVACVSTEDAEAFPPLPAGTFITCSSDSTIRYWNLNPKSTLTKGELDHSEISNASRPSSVSSMPPPAPPSSRSIKSPAAAATRGARPRNAYMREMLMLTYVDNEDGFVQPSPGSFLSGCGNESHQVYSATSWPARCILNSSFDTESGMPFGTLLDIGVRSIAVQPGNHHLAVGDRQGNIRVFDVERNACEFYEVAHDAEVLTLAYSPSPGRYLASGSRDRLVHIFDTQAPKAYDVATTLADHASSVTTVQFTPNGNQLITGASDAAINFYKVEASSPSSANASFTRSKQVCAPHTTVYDFDVDVTSKNLATAGQDKKVHVWALRTSKMMRAFKPEAEAKDVNRVCFDPSGLHVAASSVDKAICLYDFFTGRCIARTCGHSELITGLAFTPDCRRLISVSGDGCIFVWRLSSSLTKAMVDRLIEIQNMRRGVNGTLISPPNTTPLLNESTASGPQENDSSRLLTNISSITSEATSPPTEFVGTAAIVAKRPVGQAEIRPPSAPRVASPVRTRPVAASAATQLHVQPPVPILTVSPVKVPAVITDSLSVSDIPDMSMVEGACGPSSPTKGLGAPADITSPQAVASSPLHTKTVTAEDLEFRQSVLPAWARPQAPAAMSRNAHVNPPLPGPAGRPASKWAALMTTSNTVDLFATPPQESGEASACVPEEGPDADGESDERDEEPAELPAGFHKPLENIPITRESFSVSVIDQTKRVSIPEPSVITEAETGPNSDELEGPPMIPVPDVLDSVAMSLESESSPVANMGPGVESMRQSVTLHYLRRAVTETSASTVGKPISTSTATEQGHGTMPSCEANVPRPVPAVAPSLFSKLGASVAAKLRKTINPSSASGSPSADVGVSSNVALPPTQTTAAKADVGVAPAGDALSETADLQQLLQNARIAAEAEAATAAVLVGDPDMKPASTTKAGTVACTDVAALCLSVDKAVADALAALQSSECSAEGKQQLRSKLLDMALRIHLHTSVDE